MAAGLRSAYGLSLDGALAVPFDELARLVSVLEGVSEDDFAVFAAALP